MTQTSVHYPALIYKNEKSKVFVANCIIKKLVGYGRTECDAIASLEKMFNSTSPDYPVKIKPVYQFLPELDSASRNYISR